MKLSILFISIIFLSIGCSSDYCPDYSDGFAIAQFNGEDWKSTTRAVEYLEDTFFLEFKVYNENGIIRQILSLNNIPIQAGNHTSFRPNGSENDERMACNYARLISDGDVISEAYDLLLSENNYINISSIDSINNIIKGTFNLNLAIDSLKEKYTESAPDFAIFKNGEFEVTLEE